MPKPSSASQQPESHWVLIDDFEYLCFQLAKERLGYSEPIPDYDTRNNELLESALGQPRQTYDGKLLYPTLVKQAAILFYSLIKNHPFRNGNKRIAVMTLIIFLAINNKWLKVSQSGLYLIAKDVSQSKPDEKDDIMNALEQFIEEGLQEIEEFTA